MKRLIWLLLLFCVCSPQKPLEEPDARGMRKRGEEHEQHGRFHEAVNAYEAAAAAFLREMERGDRETNQAGHIDCLNRMGWLRSVYLGDHPRAIEVLQTARERGEQFLPPDHDLRLTTLHNMAVVYYYQRELDASIALNQQLLTLRTQRYGSEHVKVAVTLNNLGLAFKARGDLDQALRYFERSLGLKQRLKTEDLYLANTWQNIGHLHLLSGRYEQAINDLETAYSLHRRRFKGDHPDVAAAAYVLGRALAATDRRREAMACLREAESIQARVFGANHPHLAHTLWELGRLHTLEGDQAPGFAALIREYQLFVTHFGEAHHHVSESLTHLAWFHWKQQALDDALTTIDRALAVFRYRPGQVSIHGSTIDDAFLLALHGKAVILASMFLKQHADDGTGVHHLQEALVCLRDGVEIVKRKRLGFPSQQSRLMLNRRYRQLLSSGVHLSTVLYLETGVKNHLESGFAFSEQSKMAVLRDTVFEAQARIFAGVPQALIEREQQLRGQLETLDGQLARASDGAEPMTTDRLRGELLEACRVFEAFRRDLEDRYPSYHQLRYQQSIPGLAEVARHIGSKALVAYHDSPQVLTIFTADRNGGHVTQAPSDGRDQKGKWILPIEDWLVEQGDDNPLRRDLEKLRSSLIFSKREPFLFYGRKLYRTLIEPVASEIGQRDLHIIPDARFGYLPFEVLLTAPVTKGTGQNAWDLPYLIKSRTLSYSDTVGGARFDTGGLEKTAGGYAYAPVSFGGDELPIAFRTAGVNPEPVAPLPFSEREVQEIGALFQKRGRPFGIQTRDEASETHFRQSGGRAEIIHFATHAIIDEARPAQSRLLFSSENNKEDGVLHLNELYALQLQAELVVLSACDTGRGAVVSGEGVLGFCRAFRYAGAKRILVSAWQVADASTTTLMVDFYRELLDGKPYAQALRTARLKMMATGNRPRDWAPFILVGSE